jgi:hypothetical protein
MGLGLGLVWALGIGYPMTTAPPSELGLTRDGVASRRLHMKPEAYGMLSRSIQKKVHAPFARVSIYCTSIHARQVHKKFPTNSAQDCGSSTRDIEMPVSVLDVFLRYDPHIFDRSQFPRARSIDCPS